MVIEIQEKKQKKGKRSIALFLSSLEIGGTQRVMIHLAQGFIKKGFIVDVVVINAHGPFLKMLPAEAHLIDLGERRALSAIPALVCYLRKNRPDAILSGLTHINSAAIISRFFSAAKSRLVVSERSNLSQKTQHAVRLLDKYAKLLINFLYPFADAVVAVSKDAANDLTRYARLDPRKIIPIYNPFPVDEIRDSSKSNISHPWFFDGAIPVILAVGRLSPPKDYPTLISAFNILRQRKPARLMIIGEGEDRLRIEKIINISPYSQEICLMGNIDNPYPYMAKSKAFVLSSAWEGFPNVLVEALACGATIVSTDCHSGPGEILENGKYGRLVPVGDPIALADAIERSLINPFPAKQCIARAREFSVEKAVAQYIQVLLPGLKVNRENH